MLLETIDTGSGVARYYSKAFANNQQWTLGREREWLSAWFTGLYKYRYDY